MEILSILVLYGNVLNYVHSCKIQEEIHAQIKEVFRWIRTHLGKLREHNEVRKLSTWSCPPARDTVSMQV